MRSLTLHFAGFLGIALQMALSSGDLLKSATAERLRMVDLLPKWHLLSWWKKSAALSSSVLLIALAMILVGITISNNLQISIRSKSQFCTSILPLILLLLMGGAARLQQRLNQRGGPAQQVDERR